MRVEIVLRDVEKISAAHWVSHHEEPYVKTCTQDQGGGVYPYMCISTSICISIYLYI